LEKVRKARVQPNAELLSPTRLQNVTSIERLIVQLEDTEKSFEKFWFKQETRLQHRLGLRQFEEEFRGVGI